MPTISLRITLLALVSGLAVSPALAQAPVLPAGWTVVPARPAPDSGVSFSTMAPGWHVVAKLGTTMFDTSRTLSGNFEVESELYLFSSAAGAGVGIAVGGRELGGASPLYTAFLVGPDSRFRVVQQRGAASRVLLPWTANAAIARHPGGNNNVKQRLGVRADSVSVSFIANDRIVARLPRELIAPHGHVGLSVDAGSNAHIATLRLDGRNIAPETARP